MKIKAIITGASGMVGEGVLHECLLDESVDSILVVGRKTCGMTHPKLNEILIDNFFDLSTIERIQCLLLLPWCHFSWFE